MTGNHLQTYNSFNICHVQLHFVASVLAIQIVLGFRGALCHTVKKNNRDNRKIKHNRGQGERDENIKAVHFL